MENTEANNQEVANQIIEHAAHLLVQEDKTPTEVRRALVDLGVEEESAALIVQQLGTQIEEAKLERARKDMLYGALWCIGGTVLTFAEIGYIFWGAIVFGGIQFIRGAINS